MYALRADQKWFKTGILLPDGQYKLAAKLTLTYATSDLTTPRIMWLVPVCVLNIFYQESFRA